MCKSGTRKKCNYVNQFVQLVVICATTNRECKRRRAPRRDVKAKGQFQSAIQCILAIHLANAVQSLCPGQGERVCVASLLGLRSLHHQPSFWTREINRAEEARRFYDCMRRIYRDASFGGSFDMHNFCGHFKGIILIRKSHFGNVLTK